jgi:hypothetical protein
MSMSESPRTVQWRVFDSILFLSIAGLFVGDVIHTAQKIAPVGAVVGGFSGIVLAVALHVVIFLVRRQRRKLG